MIACSLIYPATGQKRAEGKRPSAVAVAAQSPKPVAVPKIEYRGRVLANGLEVYTTESHKSPTVAIQVWYKVGGKNDPEKKSGFAHLFEHLMFKATKNMKAENIDRLTEFVGGENNAYTTEDRTVYHETVPSNYLETLIWAEADRMANLNVDEPDFISERAVVEEEYRQSVLAPPYGRLFEYVNQRSFRSHPYRRGVIGSIADLDAATIEDVRRFHATFYRPDNAVLIVSGDFEPAKLDAWVDKYFGRIKRPSEPIPVITQREPARAEAQQYDETGPNVPLPAVVVDYLVPPASSADAPVLQIAGTILSNGASSRLYQSLVYKQQVASSASARADLRKDAGLFEFTTIAAGGKPIEAVEKSTLDEVERLKNEPVSEAELSKARNQLVTAALRRRETVDGRAAALGEAVVALGSPDRVNTEIARLSAVTAPDILQAAKKYFTPSNRVVIRYRAGTEEQGGASHAVAAAPKQAPAPETRPEENAPPPAAPRPTVIPKPLSTGLPNGIRIVVVPRPGTGLVTVLAAVKAGAADDPPEQAGLADFTAAMLLRGAGTKSATQVAESIERLGGSITSSAAWDSSTVGITVMSSHAAEAMSVLSDVLQRPTFDPAEATRLQKQKLDNLAVSLRSPGAIAQFTAARVVFEEGPYGHALGGTPESVSAIKPGDVREFYLANYAPQKTVLVFGGDITLEEASSLATRYFGSQKASSVEAKRETSPHPSTPIGRVVVIDKPDAGQAAVMLAQAGIPRTDPEYTVARVANAIFGEGYSSRINEEIRIKRGLSYGASSRFDMRRRGGLFSASAQTRNSAVAEVAKLLKEELGNLEHETADKEELTARKASLIGSYARRLETGAGIAAATADLAVYDLPLSALAAYPADIQMVTGSLVWTFAARRLPTSQSNIIIVGDSRQFLSALQKEFQDIEVIPIAQLDLNKSSLRKQ